MSELIPNTPKQLVRSVHARALAERWGDAWKIYAAPHNRGGALRECLGMGVTASAAWTDATKKLANSPIRFEKFEKRDPYAIRALAGGGRNKTRLRCGALKFIQDDDSADILHIAPMSKGATMPSFALVRARGVWRLKSLGPFVPVLLRSFDDRDEAVKQSTPWLIRFFGRLTDTRIAMAERTLNRLIKFRRELSAN